MYPPHGVALVSGLNLILIAVLNLTPSLVERKIPGPRLKRHTCVTMDSVLTSIILPENLTMTTCLERIVHPLLVIYVPMVS